MFNCKIDIDGKTIHDQNYKNLKEICEDLNLSYNQVAEYSSGRVKRRATNNFRFHPVVNISRVKVPNIS